MLGLPLEEHIGNVIGLMRERADALGLRGHCDRSVEPAPAARSRAAHGVAPISSCRPFVRSAPNPVPPTASRP